MFSFFKKKKESNAPRLKDLNQLDLQVGDKVKSLRYDMGISTIEESEQGIVYVSESTNQTVHWTKMIDAATELQKVYKLENQPG